MGFFIYDRNGDKVRYANKYKEAQFLLTHVQGGRIAKIRQTKMPNASKKKFAVRDLRYKKYISIT